MESLNLADMFVAFLAVLGPQKVLLSFARLAQTLGVRDLRLVAASSALCAALLETACALTAPWIAAFFHVSTPSLRIAAAVVFFAYAMGLVFGFHFDPGPDGDAVERDAGHPLASGLRAMLLPFVVSPLAVAAALEGSLSARDWAGRWAVAGAFAAVALVDFVCAWAFAPLLRRLHTVILELLSRLLGVLLTAVGVQMFLVGLAALSSRAPGAH
jgi:multiple antibiotic resistance protein